MTGEVWIPMVKANVICRRAIAQYLANHEGSRGFVRHSIPFRDFTAASDGWVRVANLADDLVCLHYDICWHPELEAVRLGEPRK